MQNSRNIFVRMRICIIAAFALLIGTCSVSGSLCPCGYEEFSGACYKLQSGLKGFWEARQECQTEGADLVSIVSSSDNDFVNALANGSEVWLGLYRDQPAPSGISLDRRTGWRWTSGAPYTQSLWDSYQPEAGDQFATTSGDPNITKWHGTVANQYPFICKKDVLPADGSLCSDKLCLSVIRNRVTHSEASSRCQTLGAALVHSSVIVSPKYAEIIQPTLCNTQAANFWIKGSCSAYIYGANPTVLAKPCDTLQQAICARAQSCSCGWTEYDGRCYKTFDNMVTQNEADVKCQDEGAYLATILSPPEMNFLANLLSGENHWVGLKKESGTWQWMNRDQYLYSYMNTLQFTGANECLVVNANTWTPQSCASTARFVCEKPKAQGSPSTRLPVCKDTVCYTPRFELLTGQDATLRCSEDGLVLAEVSNTNNTVLGDLLHVAGCSKFWIKKSEGSCNLVTYDAGIKIRSASCGEQHFSICMTAPPESKNMSIGVISAVVIVGCFLVIALVIGIICLIKRRRAGKGESGDIYEPMQTHSIPHNGQASFANWADDSLYTNLGKQVLLENLASYVNDAKKTRLLEDEFKSIPYSSKAPRVAGKKKSEAYKNRFSNIIPYDHNRVVLSSIHVRKHSDYINASYIPGHGEYSYIATQGPVDPFVTDFWRMVWEQNAKLIVMMTNVRELGKEQCDRYWPETNQVKVYENITVSMDKMETFPDYTITHLIVSKNDQMTKTEDREIKHFHFISWPVKSVPKQATAIINFHRKCKLHMTPGVAPTIVHCSAGVGRSGTFIALDILLDLAKLKGVTDVYKCVSELRRHRMGMVQTQEQYTFIYDALVEYSTIGETTINVSEYLDTYQTLTESGQTPSKINSQFEMLEKLRPQLIPSSLAAAKDWDNQNKNRSTDILPPNHSRVKLISPFPGRNQYINAVFVNSYREAKVMIATQAPLPHTVVDFWRMVADYRATSIVCLCPEADIESECKYWPENGAKSLQQYEVIETSLEEEDHFNIRYLTLVHESAERHIRQIVVHSNLSTMDRAELMVTLLSIHKVLNTPLSEDIDYENAPRLDDPEEESHHIYDNVDEVNEDIETKTGPVIIHCMFGAEWSGLLCALRVLLERIDTDNEIDVFNTVKMLHMARPQFIQHQDQSTLLYDILAHHLSKQGSAESPEISISDHISEI